MGDARLTDNQLAVICLLCNGHTMGEIADAMNYSLTYISRLITQAKRRTGAKTTAHLVSIVIASGLLYYTEDGERTTESPAAVADGQAPMSSAG